MAKRVKTRLPRLTLMCYSKTDLLRFVEASERIAQAANDLRIVAQAVEQLRGTLIALEQLGHELREMANGKAKKRKPPTMEEILDAHAKISS